MVNFENFIYHCLRKTKPWEQKGCTRVSLNCFFGFYNYDVWEKSNNCMYTKKQKYGFV